MPVARPAPSVSSRGIRILGSSIRIVLCLTKVRKSRMGPKPDCVQSGKTFRPLKVSLRHQRQCKESANLSLLRVCRTAACLSGGSSSAKIVHKTKYRTRKDSVFSDRAIVMTYRPFMRSYSWASRSSRPRISMLSAVMWGCGSALSATSSVVSPERTSTPIAPALWAICTSV